MMMKMLNMFDVGIVSVHGNKYHVNYMSLDCATKYTIVYPKVRLGIKRIDPPEAHRFLGHGSCFHGTSPTPSLLGHDVITVTMTNGDVHEFETDEQLLFQ